MRRLRAVWLRGGVGSGVLRPGLQPVLVTGDRQSQHLADRHRHRYRHRDRHRDRHRSRAVTVIFAGAGGVILCYTAFAYRVFWVKSTALKY